MYAGLRKRGQNNQKKCHKSATFHMWKDAPVVDIVTKIGMLTDVPDVVLQAEYEL